MTRQVPVALNDANPNSSQFISSKGEMVEVFQDLFAITSVLANGITAEELLAKKVVDHDGRGRPIGEIADYELRFKRLRFSVSGFLNKVPQVKLRWNCGKQFDAYFNGLIAEQPNCDWCVVAANIYEQDMTGRRARAVPTEAYDAPKAQGQASALQAWTKAAAPEEAHKHTLSDTTQDFHTPPETRLYLEIAVANIDQGELRDPWADDNDGKAGKMAKYLKTRQLRHLPRHLRRQREDAEVVIRRMFGLPVQEEAPPAPGPTVDLKAEVPATIVELDDEVCEKAYAANQAGQRWLDIAEPLGQSWQTVRAAVVQWRRKTAPDTSAPEVPVQGQGG